MTKELVIKDLNVRGAIWFDRVNLIAYWLDTVNPKKVLDMNVFIDLLSRGSLIRSKSPFNETTDIYISANRFYKGTN